MIPNDDPEKPSICVPAAGACETLIDGGVVQNNPSTYAMSIAMMHADAKRRAGSVEPARPIRLLSIGTGGSPIFNRVENIENEDLEFSMLDWFKEFSYISMSVPQMHATYESSSLADNFLRIDLKSPSPMDDASAVDSLIE